MKNIWNFLNGKKLIIGLFILWLSDKLWFTNLFPLDYQVMVNDIMSYAGGILAGTGAVHKGYKAYEEHEEKKVIEKSNEEDKEIEDTWKIKGTHPKFPSDIDKF